jgi:hypothetical protein
VESPGEVADGSVLYGLAPVGFRHLGYKDDRECRRMRAYVSFGQLRT